MSVLQVQNLSKRYTVAGSTVDALKSISFDLQAGERLAVVGPSGSGKSTLLGLLAGLDEASSGSVSVAGTDITNLYQGALAAYRGKNIGIVFQSYRLLPHASALENVMVPMELAGTMPTKDIQRTAQEWLERVGLGQRSHHLPSKLSGGEQQRVALARALVNKPSLLLADEPTGNLDSRTGSDIADLLLGLSAEADHALVLVTHDAELAERADRVLELADGDLQADRPGKHTSRAAQTEAEPSEC